MKLNIYCDREGIFGFVSELPEKPKFIDTMEWVENCYNDRAKDEYRKSLEKIKSSAIRFKDQDGIRILICEHYTDLVDGGHIEPEIFEGVPDTFYSIELEGYEVVFEDACGHDSCPVDAGCDHCKEPVKLAILKPVASQKETNSGISIDDILKVKEVLGEPNISQIRVVENSVLPDDMIVVSTRLFEILKNKKS